jgi:hypothetical protein
VTSEAKCPEQEPLGTILSVRCTHGSVGCTTSHSGANRAKRCGYPWHELWIAGQWLLEPMILRLLGYAGRYRNRDRLADFDPIEQAPWA